MDEINYAVCSGPGNSIGMGEEGRLMDRRDGKIYWVAKLADGLCWMTQNLDYDGGGLLSTSFVSDDTTNNIAKYYDPGEYINIQPTTASACSGITTTTSLKDCAGWKSFSKDLLYTTDLSPTIAEELHYSTGNYYNWLAATNGTGLASVTSGDAFDSVCPWGWSLPIGNTTTILNASTALGSFGKLFISYGSNSGLKYGTQDIRLAPLYFVYGGRILHGSMSEAGGYGWYWSSTANGDTDAYDLYFNFYVNSNTNVISTSRYSGLSVRCVAR